MTVAATQLVAPYQGLTEEIIARGIELTGWDVRRFASYDLETYQVSEVNLTPRMVCGSIATMETGGFLLDRDEAFEVAEQIINSSDLVMIGANLAFDLAVLLVERPDLLPGIFRMLAEGRVFDVLLGQGLEGIAGGHLGLTIEGLPMRKPSTGQVVDRYSLEVVVHQVLGRMNAKENDDYRLGYAALDGIPQSQWPWQARQYPIDDTCNALEAAVAMVTGWGKCKQPNMDPHRNLRDMGEQTRAAFAEHLASVKGLHVDQEAVDKFEAEVVVERRKHVREATKASLLRLKGSKKATVELLGAAVYERVTRETALAEKESRNPVIEFDDDELIKIEEHVKASKAAGRKNPLVKLSSDKAKTKRLVLTCMGAGDCAGGPAPLPPDNLRHVEEWLEEAKDCAVCGRPLEDPDSIARGMGPNCARKYVPERSDEDVGWWATVLSVATGLRSVLPHLPGWGTRPHEIVADLTACVARRPDADLVRCCVDTIAALGFDDLARELRGGQRSLARWAVEDGRRLEEYANRSMEHAERARKHAEASALPLEQARRLYKGCTVCMGTGIEVPDGVELTPKGDVSVSREVLLSQDHPDLRALAGMGLSDKAVGTYIPYLRKGRPTVHPRPNVLLVTGRSSYDGPIQQMPRSGRERACFVAPAGYSIVSIDYSGIECVTWAQACLWLLGHSDMAQAINAGVDLHSDLASMLMGGRYDWQTIKKLAKEDPNSECGRMRQASKSANFGFPGGMGALKFVKTQRKGGVIICRFFGHEQCRNILVTDHQDRVHSVCANCFDLAKELRKQWMRKWGEARPYFDRVQFILDSTGEVPTLIPHPEIEGEIIHARIRGGVDRNAACNNFFQSLAAVGAKRALWRLTRECWEGTNPALLGTDPRLFIHDEFLFYSPDEMAKIAMPEAGRIMVEEMRSVIPDVAVGVKTEGKIMKKWLKG